MAYIGHYDIPSYKTAKNPRGVPQRIGRVGYYAILVAFALVPIAVPLLAKHLGLF